MEHVTNPWAYVAAYAIAIGVTPYLHEGSHWAVGKLGKTGPIVEWKIARWIWPKAVRHRNIETMDPSLIRLSGFAIFLWIPPWVLSLGYLAAEISPWTLGVALVPFLVVFGLATESDVLAIRDPEKYRELSLEDNLPGAALFNQYFVIAIFAAGISYPVLPL